MTWREILKTLQLPRKLQTDKPARQLRGCDRFRYVTDPYPERDELQPTNYIFEANVVLQNASGCQRLKCGNKPVRYTKETDIRHFAQNNCVEFGINSLVERRGQKLAAIVNVRTRSPTSIPTYKSGSDVNSSKKVPSNWSP